MAPPTATANPGAVADVRPILIITGLSGSGKSLAARVFEDLGYYCVDNLPVALIPVFADLVARSQDSLSQVALVIDIREGAYLHDFPKIVTDLRQRGVPTRILWFEATNDALIRRFSETRRPHPLSVDLPLDTAIARERAMMTDVRDMADRVIDTTRYNAHELRAFLKQEFSQPEDHAALQASVVSFGFKYGLPMEADLVFDVRFLQNPFFVERLKRKTGLDPEVLAFLRDLPEYNDFLARLDEFMGFLLPGYVKEGKSYLTVAIGCTGGKHRSVAAAEAAAGLLSARGWPARVTHRDIDKE
jgi:UPF0042 nucleotide-binding protein